MAAWAETSWRRDCGSSTTDASLQTNQLVSTKRARVHLAASSRVCVIAWTTKSGVNGKASPTVPRLDSRFAFSGTRGSQPRSLSWLGHAARTRAAIGKSTSSRIVSPARRRHGVSSWYSGGSERQLSQTRAAQLWSTD